MNLLEPLIFNTEYEARKYAKRHACAFCLCDLQAMGREVECPDCGATHKHQFITRNQAKIATKERSIGTIEINAARRPRRSAEEIIKELGF